MSSTFKDSFPKIGLGISAFSLLITSAGALAAPPSGTKNLLIQPRAGLPDHVLAKLIENHHAEVVDKIGAINVKVVNVPEQAASALKRALANNPHINFVEEDMMVPLNATPNDPKLSSEWHLSKIQTAQAWDGAKGDKMVIAILDSGVDPDHPDLASKLVTGWNSVSQNSDSVDINGHGTKVAGAAAAITNNATGVAGVAWNAQIMPIRITNRSDGWAYWSDMARGLTWAADHGADVANMSYNATGSSTVTSAASYMRNKGGLAVASAGNDSSDTGRVDNSSIITVSATNSSDVRPSWSNYGNDIDVSAPGAGILSTTNGGGYGSVSGTSFSAPITAGVIALIKSANPNLSPDQVEKILESSADDIGTSGWDKYYGHGRVNANAAVQMAKNSTTTDTQAPTIGVYLPTTGDLSGIVDIDVRASDNTGVSEVSVYIDNKLLGTDTTAAYTFAWDTTSGSNGSHALKATAKDSAGNIATYTANVNVNNTTTSEPTTPVVSDTTVPSILSLSPADGTAYSVGDRIQLSAVASDNVGVTAMNCYVNGKFIGSSASDTISCSINTRKASPGTYTLKVDASDAAGNKTSKSVNVTLTASTNNGNKGGRKK